MKDNEMDGTVSITGWERQQRVELSAALHISARFGWHESPGCCFSMAVSEDGRRFLMNPRHRHVSRVTASDLVLVGAGLDASQREDIQAAALHGAIHSHLTQARCVMRLRPPYATALSCLEDPVMKPIDAGTARFFRRVGFDFCHGGVPRHGDDVWRLCEQLNSYNVVLMSNHGVVVIGETVAETFDRLYHFELACRTLMTAYASGQRLRILSDEAAEYLARGFESETAGSALQFAELKRWLDVDDVRYRV